MYFNFVYFKKYRILNLKKKRKEIECKLNAKQIKVNKKDRKREREREREKQTNKQENKVLN